MGQSFEQSLHGLPHSFLLFKKVLKILNLPPIAIKAPKGHINLQKNLSINIPKNNNKTTYKTKYHSLLNFIDIAVLKGSTSEPRFNNPGDTKQDKNNDRSKFINASLTATNQFEGQPMSILLRTRNLLLSIALTLPLVACSPGSCDDLSKKAWEGLNSLSERELDHLANNC